MVIDKVTEVVRAFESGRCDAFTDDASQLAAVRATQVAKPDDYEILPERFSKEPLGPMVRQGDENWLGIVRWTLFALLEAEEYGITQKNVDEMLKSNNPNVARILGVTPGAARTWGWTRSGPITPSRRWATTAKCSSATWARQQAEPATRHQCAVEQGRRHVSVADPLIR